MCVDPVTMMVVGGAVGAAGNLFAGFSAKQSADANAAALETAAKQREQKAQFDIEQATRKYTRQTGTVIAKAASTNVDLSSFDSVLADDAKESMLERKAISVSAQIDEANLRFQAAGQKAAGKAAEIGGIFAAGGSILKAGSDYQTYRALSAKSKGGVSLDDGGDAYN